MIEIMSSMSLAQVQFPPELPKRDEILSFMSVPSAPHPLQGGGTTTTLRDMKTKIIRVRQ